MSTGYESTYPATGYGSETQIRNEFSKIQTALEDTISRSNTGDGPNEMKVDLDMGGNTIFNTQDVMLGGESIYDIIDGISKGYADAAEQSAIEASREADRAAKLAGDMGVGYQFAGDYAADIEITEYNQLVRDANGEFWRVSGQVELPYTTTGAGLPEDDTFIPSGDAVLRQDLASSSEGSGLVAYGETTVEAALGELEQFNADLADPSKGAAMVAYQSGSVSDKLDEIVSGAVTEPHVDAKVHTHNQDYDAHPDLRARVVSEVSSHVTDEADRAEIARDAAFVNADVYPDITTGRAAVADGEQFQVATGGGYLVRFRRDSASTQTEVARIQFDSAKRLEPIITLTTTGTSSAQTGTVDDMYSYRNGQIFWWFPGNVISFPATININSLGPLTLTRGDLQDGEVLSGRGYLFRISTSTMSAQILNVDTLPNEEETEVPTIASSGSPTAQTATLAGYEEYKNGDLFVWMSNSTNEEGVTLKINSLSALPVWKTIGDGVLEGDIRKGRPVVLRVSSTEGVHGFLVAGTLPSDLGGANLGISQSLQVSNPNLFTPNQAAALDKEGMALSHVTQTFIGGIPHWQSTGTVYSWGPFSRSMINGDTMSAAVNIRSFDPLGGSSKVRVMLNQYSGATTSVADEVDRQEVILDEFTPGFVRFTNIAIHPDCQSIGLFIGSTRSTGGVVTYRDMLLCAGEDATFRVASPSSASGGAGDVWVSPTGSDSNNGSSSSPFATLARAVDEIGGRGNIYLAPGLYGAMQIPANKIHDLRITGAANAGFERPVFRYGTNLSLSPVSGRPGVFSAPLERTPAWLWSDGVPDAQTLVPYSEQHSLLEGRAHRLKSTKIWHIIAANLPEALDAIENSSTPVCWRDTSTDTVYLRLPAGGDAGQVFSAFDDVGLISGIRPTWSPQGRLELIGIDVRYGNINTKSFRSSSLTDVHVLGAGVDGFDIGNWSELDRCSAGGCGSGDGLGDGFNAHNHAEWTYRDCYGYDNWDDGESSHQNCRVTGWGNIMEYNGGGGFVPANGAQEILHNCISRKNSIDPRGAMIKQGGFTCVGSLSPTDPGIITSLETYNCISIGDRNGFYDGTGNAQPTTRRLLAVGCKAFDAVETAFACAEIIDCSETGSTTEKSTGTVVRNTSVIT